MRDKSEPHAISFMSFRYFSAVPSDDQSVNNEPQTPGKTKKKWKRGCHSSAKDRAQQVCTLLLKSFCNHSFQSSFLGSFESKEMTCGAYIVMWWCNTRINHTHQCTSKVQSTWKTLSWSPYWCRLLVHNRKCYLCRSIIFQFYYVPCFSL